jgi:predicted RNA binding protein YcfA (HicA-like mRNA interferase family)
MKRVRMASAPLFRIYQPVHLRIVTIAGHRLSDEVPRGTLNNILKQAELK